MLYTKYLLAAIAAMLLSMPAGAVTAATFNVSPGSGIITYNGDPAQQLYGQVVDCDGREMKFGIGGTTFDCAAETTPFNTGPFAASDWFPEDDSVVGFFSTFTGVSANWLGELTGNVGFPFVSTRDDGTRALYGLDFGGNGSGFVQFGTNPFRDSDSPMSPIPLPAAVWMLVAALGSLGTVGAFRRKGAG